MSLIFDRKKIIGILVLILIVSIFRLPVFFLSHNNNDELIHLSLAMKVDKYGLSVFQKQQYNLFYVERGFIPERQLIGVFEGKDRIGSLLKGFLGEQENLSHHPPAIPFFLSLSHRLFFKNFPYLINISRDILFMFRNIGVQFYACFISFFGSILLILSVYFLGSILFSHKIGLLSAFFLSLTPAELITANKIWADDMTAFFITLAVIFYLYALKNNKPVFSLLSGFSCGFSILTKMSGVYLIFIILLFHIFEHRNKKVDLKNLINFIFDRNILYFLAGVFIASAWWFNLYLSQSSIAAHRGFFTVNEKWDVAKTWNPFFNVVSTRPWFSYFVLIPFQSPLYLLSYIFIPVFALRNKIKFVKDFIGKEYRYLQFMIMWMAVVFVFLTLKPGKEERYVLIAYPAISILSVYCLNLFYEWMKNKNFGISFRLQNTLFISVMLLSIFISLKIALPRVLFRADIIPIPF